MPDVPTQASSHARPDASNGCLPVRRLTWPQHLLGAAFVLAALGALALLPLLPARSARALDLEFLAGFSEPVVVAFAGYPACGTACPTSLAIMARAGDRLAEGTAGLAFINIDRGADPDFSRRFARAFHPRFQAFTVDAVRSRDLRAALGIRTFEDTARRPAHPPNVYLLARAGDGLRLRHIYRAPPSADELAKDVLALARESEIHGSWRLP